MMHKGVEWVSPDTSITAIAEMMQEGDIGAIPVGENDRLVGMVTDRDLAVRGLVKGTDISKLTAKDVMTKGVTWCRDNDSATEAARFMESKHIRRLPVIDEKKRMVGMLSLGDISHAASQKTAAEALKAVSAHHAWKRRKRGGGKMIPRRFSLDESSWDSQSSDAVEGDRNSH